MNFTNYTTVQFYNSYSHHMKHNLMSGHASIRIVRCIPQVPIGQTSQVLYKSTEIFWNKMAAQSWQFVLPEPVHAVHLVSQATQPSGFCGIFPSSCRASIASFRRTLRDLYEYHTTQSYKLVFPISSMRRTSYHTPHRCESLCFVPHSTIGQKS